MKLIFVLFVGVLIGVGIGNKDGDQATLQDCATKGVAVMKGGGVIECKVQQHKS